MLDERELALKPIVGESVGHNARVSHPSWLADPAYRPDT